VTLLAGAWTGDPQPGDFVFLLFFVGGTWAVGRLVRQRALHADAAASVQAQVAVTAERARIARELHDVVAHSISIVSVQAAAADAYLDRDAAQAREHLDAVRRTAHDALSEMRRLCGVLREDAAVLLPQPTLDRVSELVAEARGAGVQLELVQEGERRELPPGLDLAAFRILQEALTNVRKHATGAAVTVELDGDSEGLRVHVRNGPPPDATGPLIVRADSLPGGGHGLIGLRERAELLGGGITHRHTSDGGFELIAKLPTRPASASSVDLLPH
jgi:signal transduction histidine kinase